MAQDGHPPGAGGEGLGLMGFRLGHDVMTEGLKVSAGAGFFEGRPGGSADQSPLVFHQGPWLGYNCKAVQ